MSNECTGNCLECGKCNNFQILETFHNNGYKLEPRKGYAVAADIGTTTIVLALIDLESGKLIARHSFLNPQREYGPDVISRIHAANEGHLEQLRRLITESLISGINTLCKSYNIEEIVISGNTTMIYLFLGFPCHSLGVFPFKPEFKLKNDYNYPDIFTGLKINCSTPLSVRIIPWFTAFVGGDIIAGLLCTKLEGKNCFMLIDLGTNGEMALYNNGSLIVTSTAAGPAFESIVHRRASEVIGDLASLIRDKMIDETGLLEKETIFTQKQIRDFQLAKSAVRCGLDILLEESGMNYNSLDAVYLAGGIGQFMNVNDAITIGLIPQELSSKTHAVGNSSLGGAIRYLLSPVGTMNDIQALLCNFKEINLAENKYFNDMFMENIFFKV